MKLSAVSVVALAFVALAPAAQAQDPEAAIRACAESFIANHFAGQQTAVRVERPSNNGPLILRNHESPVKLVATSKATGQVLAVATCNSNDGVVNVLPIASAAIAAR